MMAMNNSQSLVQVRWGKVWECQRYVPLFVFRWSVRGLQATNGMKCIDGGTDLHAELHFPSAVNVN
jgi:hypothetical protein